MSLVYFLNDFRLLVNFHPKNVIFQINETASPIFSHFQGSNNDKDSEMMKPHSDDQVHFHPHEPIYPKLVYSSKYLQWEIGYKYCLNPKP